MKTIDLQCIDTFTLSQEDVLHLPIHARKAYALAVSAREMAARYSVSYEAGLEIAKDSLTSLKVVWS